MAQSNTEDHIFPIGINSTLETQEGIRKKVRGIFPANLMSIEISTLQNLDVVPRTLRR
jgi:hypothetical protein